jgi:glycosyltransferase involved in cell wall biosynthesis
VPTTHVKNVFEQSGVTVPIHVVRHALLHGLLAEAASPRTPLSGGRRDFYTIGSWNARKNVEGLIRAYFAVGWNVESPVHLACHCVPATRDEGTMQSMSWIAQEGAKNLYMSASNAGVLPPFGLLTTARSYEEMYAFHRQHNIFVTASRGEGFCIPIVEALAFGNQVIASGPWLNDLRTVVLDDGSLVIVPVQSVPITPMPECRGYELDHRWWEPDVDKLVAALHAATGCCDSKVAAAVREHYSPAAVGHVLAERLTSI